MSVKGTIYKALADRLMDKLTFAVGVELPSLKWVDKENAQFLKMEKGYPIPLPAITIRFVNTDWTTNGRNVQDGNAVIEFSIGYENYSDSFEGSVNQDDALKFYEFNEQVFAALQGFSGEGFTALQRINDGEDDDHDAMIVSKMSFTTLITDTGAETHKDYVLAPINPKPVFKELINRPPTNFVSGFVI